MKHSAWRAKCGVKGGVERDGCRTLGDRGLALGRVSKTHKSQKVSKAEIRLYDAELKPRSWATLGDAGNRWYTNMWLCRGDHVNNKSCRLGEYIVPSLYFVCKCT
jgi:hypothetical protein